MAVFAYRAVQYCGVISLQYKNTLIPSFEERHLGSLFIGTIFIMKFDLSRMPLFFLALDV